MAFSRRQRDARNSLPVLFSVPVAGILLQGCLMLSTLEHQDHGVILDAYELVTGRAKHQTALTGFLLGGDMAELAVVSVGESNDRRLQIFAFADSTWAPTLDVPLGRSVMFVDVASIDGRDRLLIYERGRVKQFDPELSSETELLRVTSNHYHVKAGNIPQIDITRDVNGDGLDDLVLPDVDGFWISTQLSDGSFADAVKLGPPEPFLDEIALEDTRTYGEVGLTTMTIPWYLSRVHVVDYDMDGRSDLVFWNESHFEVHLQDADGSFDPSAQSFPVDVHVDSDGMYSNIFGFSGESTFNLLFGFRPRSERTVLHSLRDMNGDGVADLVTHTLEGRSILRQRGLLAVHYGTPAPQGTLFARDASTTIRGKRPTTLGYQTHELGDLDGDGQVEIMYGRVSTGMVQVFRALVGNSIAMDLDFYRMEDGAYPEEPNATRNILPDVNLVGRRGPFFPTVLAGDINADGLLDLAVGQSRTELRIFVGVPGPDLFAPNPQKVNIALTDDERNARLVDLNGDRKEDLLVHYPSSTEPHRVAILMAR